jgi:penicillin-binding protein 1A
VAGKTGTTNDLKDAWFAGFVPQLAAVVWIGYDQERPLGPAETGAQAAAPAWVAFMQKALRGMPPQEFTIPETIEFHPIDAETGLLAGEDAAEPNIEVFAPGTAPSRSASEEKKPKGRDFFRLDVEDQ